MAEVSSSLTAQLLDRPILSDVLTDANPATEGPVTQTIVPVTTQPDTRISLASGSIVGFTEVGSLLPAAPTPTASTSRIETTLQTATTTSPVGSTAPSSTSQPVSPDMATTITTTPPQATQTIVQNVYTQDSGLGSTTLVAILVPITVVLVLIPIIVYCCWRRRTRTRRNDMASPVPQKGNKSSRYTIQTLAKNVELDEAHIQEVEAVEKSQELPGRRTTRTTLRTLARDVELSGNRDSVV